MTDWDAFEKQVYDAWRAEKGKSRLLSDEELEAIVRMAVEAWMAEHPDEDPESDECIDFIMKIVRWRENMLIANDLFQMCMKGLVYPKESGVMLPAEEDFLFGLTPFGEEVGEEIERQRREGGAPE